MTRSAPSSSHSRARLDLKRHVYQVERHLQHRRMPGRVRAPHHRLHPFVASGHARLLCSVIYLYFCTSDREPTRRSASPFSLTPHAQHVQKVARARRHRVRAAGPAVQAGLQLRLPAVRPRPQNRGGRLHPAGAHNSRKEETPCRRPSPAQDFPPLPGAAVSSPVSCHDAVLLCLRRSAIPAGQPFSGAWSARRNTPARRLPAAQGLPHGDAEQHRDGCAQGQPPGRPATCG